MDKLDLAPLPLALRLKLLRIYAGWPAKDAAEYFGHAAKWIYSREDGSAEPSDALVDYYYRRAIEAADRYASHPAGAQPEQKDRAEVRAEVGEALEVREQQRRGRDDQSRRQSKG